MSTEQFWAGDFGSEYTERNNVDYKARQDFFSELVEFLDPKSVMEYGCNKGHNLKALYEASPSMKLYGIDINGQAIEKAKDLLPDAMFEVGSNESLTVSTGAFELAFTAGVLIHVHPDNLRSVMGFIVNASERYVMAIEYYAPECEEINYRGNAGKLWKNDFGKLYQEWFDLELLVSGDLNKEDGFDNCRYWIFEKI